MDIDEVAPLDFDSWARAHETRLLGVARVVTGDPTLAHDVVQDCLIDLYRRWDVISQEGSNPMAYASRIMGSKAANYRRTAWGRRVHVTDDAAILDSGSGDPSGAVSTRLAVAGALRRLRPRQRQVVAMHYLLDMSVAEIAAELKQPVGTVTSDLTRARKSLRTDLARGGDD